MNIKAYHNSKTYENAQKNIKTFTPIGAPVIRCKCYQVQLVRGPPGFHPWIVSLKLSIELLHKNYFRLPTKVELLPLIYVT